MGKAARARRDRREAGSLPARFDFGPHHLVRSTARWIKAEPGTSGIFEIHEFGETRERPCPECGGEVIYRYGNWICPPAGPGGEEISGCGWTTAKETTGGRGARGMNNGTTTLERCPDCGGRVIYNGNYFCESWGGPCWWALPHPARRRADRDLALRLTGRTS
jgi:DNA-directed RNA polymerase subunit RPC12/RpoP